MKKVFLISLMMAFTYSISFAQVTTHKLQPGQKILIIGSPSMKVSCEDPTNKDVPTIDTSEDNVVDMFNDKDCSNTLYNLTFTKKTQLNTSSESQNCLLPDWVKEKVVKSIRVKNICVNLKQETTLSDTCNKLVLGRSL